MEKISVDEMKLIELEIMDEIDRVCRERGITYFLGYGSCLGAVRHGGFIPWDDDMDVVMMREDYERFLAVFNEVTGAEHMRAVSYRDKSAPCVFAKVVDVTTKVEERYSEARYGSGVWVDVFPLDAVPAENADKLFKGCAKYGALRYLTVTDTATGSSGFIKLAKKIVCPVLKRKGPYGYARKVDEIARDTAVPRDEALVADFVAEADADKILKRSWFNPIEWEFEGHTFFIPEHYDEYLTALYGDWKTPPPADDREMHTCNAYRL